MVVVVVVAAAAVDDAMNDYLDDVADVKHR